MKSRLKITVSILLSLFTLWWFGRPILEIYKRGERLDILRDEVSGLENKKKVMLEEIKYLKTPEYVETEARNKLSLVKVGERIVILPREGGEKSGTQTTEESLFRSENWRKWKKLFLE